jgi:hypothetical protein
MSDVAHWLYGGHEDVPAGCPAHGCPDGAVSKPIFAASEEDGSYRELARRKRRWPPQKAAALANTSIAADRLPPMQESQKLATR